MDQQYQRYMRYPAASGVAHGAFFTGLVFVSRSALSSAMGYNPFDWSQIANRQAFGTIVFCCIMFFILGWMAGLIDWSRNKRHELYWLWRGEVDEKQRLGEDFDDLRELWQQVPISTRLWSRDQLDKAASTAEVKEESTHSEGGPVTRC